MARIETYINAQSPLSGSDKMIGTDSANNNETKNFTIAELANFIGGGGASAGPQGIQGPVGPQGPAGPVGPAGLNWRGAWVSGTSYVADDAVGHAGASWFCILATSGTTTPSVDTTHWALLASQGATGPAGATGAQGPTGATGPAGPSGWNLTGNAGTTAGTNFIGTTDNVDLVFKRNNTERLRIDTYGNVIATNSFRAVGATTAVMAVSTSGNGSAMIAQDSTEKGYVYLSNGTGDSQIKCTNLTTSGRILELPDASGTLALTSNIDNRPYKVYTATITQAGTSAPTVDRIFENTLGFTPTYSYLSPGIYQINSSAAWVAAKTVAFTSPGYLSTSTIFGWYITSVNDITIVLKNASSNVNQNDLLYQATIEIRIYN